MSLKKPLAAGIVLHMMMDGGVTIAKSIIVVLVQMVAEQIITVKTLHLNLGMSTVSKYLHLFEREGRCFLYASLSNSFAEIDSEVYNFLSTVQGDSGSLDNLDEGTREVLRKMKVIEVDDEMEKNKLKSNLLLRRFNPRHLYLTINPTLACNFACPYCFEASHSPYFMTNEVEDAIIAFIQKKTQVTDLHVTWFGGEPLLAFDRIVSLSKRMQNLGLKYRAGMITNGYLLTEEKISLFEQLQIASVQITIDCSEQTHNARRFRKDGAPTYRTILKNIEEAQKILPQTSISVRVNIDRTNSDEFFDVLNYFRAKKYLNVSVNPGFVNDLSERDRNQCVYDKKSMAAFLKDAYRKHNYYSRFFYPADITSTCAVRNPNAIVIGPLGELYKCWNDVGNFDRSYGNIDGSMTNEAILYEYLVKSDYLNDPKCNACAFFPVCDGGCPYRRIQNEHAGQPQDTCSLFKENIEDFLMLRYDYRKETAGIVK